MRNTKENIHPSDELLASKPDARRNDNFKKHSELFKQITTEIPIISFEDKITESARASSEFFGQDVNPSEDCVKRAVDIYKRMEEIGLTGFEPVVTPQTTWEADNALWKQSRKQFYPKSVNIVDGGILIIDGRKTPDYSVKTQSYPNDEFIENIMEEVASQRGPYKVYKKPSAPDNLRGGTHRAYLEYNVLPKIASQIGQDTLKGAEVRLLRAVEAIAAVDMGIPLGKGGGAEWLSDYFLVKEARPNFYDHALVYASQGEDGKLSFGHSRAKSDDAYAINRGWRPVIAVPAVRPRDIWSR